MQISVTVHVELNIFTFSHKIPALKSSKAGDETGRGKSNSCKMPGLTGMGSMQMSWIIALKAKDSSSREKKNQNSDTGGSQETCENKMTRNENEEMRRLPWVETVISDKWNVKPENTLRGTEMGVHLHGKGVRDKTVTSTPRAWRYGRAPRPGSAPCLKLHWHRYRQAFRRIQHWPIVCQAQPRRIGGQVCPAPRGSLETHEILNPRDMKIHSKYVKQNLP